jgi:DNA primase
MRMDLISGHRSEEQFSCPFHGVDRKKSCRYYQETDTAYCWVCTECWDLFSFTQKREGLNFVETLNHLVKTYRVKTAHLPEAINGALLRHRSRTATKVQPRLLYTEKLKTAIRAVRDEVELEKYKKMVFGFLFLKFRTPDEKFQDSADKLREGILRAIKG